MLVLLKCLAGKLCFILVKEDFKWPWKPDAHSTHTTVQTLYSNEQIRIKQWYLCLGEVQLKESIYGLSLTLTKVLRVFLVFTSHSQIPKFQGMWSL